MASEENDAVFEHDLEDDDDESSQSQDDDDDLVNDDVLEDDDDLEENDTVVLPLPVPSPSLVVTVASVPNGSPSLNHAPSLSLSSTPDPKRQRVDSTPSVENKKPLPLSMDDSSRRLFQRLWTDEDEIELLQGFLDYTSQRGSNHPDTALFYDQIKSKLQLDFNKNQLVEKLRRLKKKYRNVLSKINSGKEFNFKTSHDQATFEISRKIWSSTGKICSSLEDNNTNLDDDDTSHHIPNPSFNDSDIKIDDHNATKSTPKSRKRSRATNNNSNSRSVPVGIGVGAVKFEEKRNFNEGFDVNVNSGNSGNVNASSLIEETVRSCLSPLFKELLSNAMVSGSGALGSSGRGVIGGLAMNAMPLSFGGGEMILDEKWRKQQILELEVYSKRLELVQDQIRAQLEELRSMGG